MSNTNKKLSPEELEQVTGGCMFLNTVGCSPVTDRISTMELNDNTNTQANNNLIYNNNPVNGQYMNGSTGIIDDHSIKSGGNFGQPA
ncbi:MAG: hypothetical protein IJI25_05630 [Eubacterium sp.]|nr:hypothetical protein [Eubacterium sp.]